jgi:hypothetical protein
MTGFSIVPLARVSPPFDLTVALTPAAVQHPAHVIGAKWAAAGPVAAKWQPRTAIGAKWEP